MSHNTANEKSQRRLVNTWNGGKGGRKVVFTSTRLGNDGLVDCYAWVHANTSFSYSEAVTHQGYHLEVVHDFARTATAIDAYDAHNDQDVTPMNARETEAWAVELERLGSEVGYAYGLDTIDINSPDTCRSCVRPGLKTAPVGGELSQARKAVAEWKERS